MEPLHIQCAPIDVASLSDTLLGGLAVGLIFLLEGSSGRGKPAIAKRFLIEGAARGESVLYIAKSEASQELHLAATSHGWTLSDKNRGVRGHPSRELAAVQPGAESALCRRRLPGPPILRATDYADLSEGAGRDPPRLSKPEWQHQLAQYIAALLG